MSENVVTLKSGSEVTESGTIRYTGYSFLLVFYSNFVLKTHHFEIFELKIRDLENRVRGPSKSLEIPPFDRADMTSYRRSIVTMAIYLVYLVRLHKDFIFSSLLKYLDNSRAALGLVGINP